MITSPFPSTSTTGPCGPFSASSRLSVRACAIASSSDARVVRRVMGGSWVGFGTQHWALLVVVFQFPPKTLLAVYVEDDAGVDGAGVDVEADGALVPLGEVFDAVDGLGL